MNSLTFETNVSDNYKLIRTMLRSTFAKIFFRIEKFEEELKRYLSPVLDFESFRIVLKMTLDRFGLLKQKVL